MKRFIRLCLLTAIFAVIAFSSSYAAPMHYVSGVLDEGDVRVFLKRDSVYVIDKEYVIKGTLIIEPGAQIQFYNNGRIIVAAGGRLIADGFAKATATPKPADVEDPITKWPLGYADMQCFLYPIGEENPAGLVKSAGLSVAERAMRERTVHPSKYNHIFNVAIDTVGRRLVNIANPYSDEWINSNISYSATGTFTDYSYASNSNDPSLIIVPYETALLFIAARMDKDPADNAQLKLNTWRRANGTTVNIEPEQISFRGIAQNNKSREWGHIIVLPGARTAFFRNCKFENFKKDVTVDTVPYYRNSQMYSLELQHLLTTDELEALNNTMLSLTNGSGGAITTFSSRTWLLDCVFENNFARNRGGALQILQAPTTAFYPSGRVIETDTVGIPRLQFDAGVVSQYSKNFKVSDVAGYGNVVMGRNADIYSRYPQIDRIDEIENPTNKEYFANDIARIAWDDARFAGYLGRFRNLEFNNNMVRLAKTASLPMPNGDEMTQDDLSVEMTYPQKWGNMAYGGALYVAGTEDDRRQIEFSLGMNDSVRLSGLLQNPNGAGYKDYIKFTGNTAQNYQKHKNTEGSKGGAIYVGKNTSLIVAGEFADNYTDAKWLVDTTGTGEFNTPAGTPTPYSNGITYSLGGAIYSHPDAAGRLQVRGGEDRNSFSKRSTTYTQTTVANTTKFVNNRAGAGGALYIAESADVLMSPAIGGSNVTAILNDYGRRIEFSKNYAYSAGGAIFTKRNAEIVGAGGSGSGDYFYSPLHTVRFDSNAAAFAGGAIYVEIPNGSDATFLANTRILNLERADFRGNKVGERAYPANNPNHVNNLLTKDEDKVRGGGAVYMLWADLNVVKAVNFEGNEVYNGNGAAIAMVNPFARASRLFLSDLDVVSYAPMPNNLKEGTPKIANGYQSIDNPFTFGVNYPDENYSYFDGYNTVTGTLKANAVKYPDVRMLNRFNENRAFVSDSIATEQMEQYGNTQMGDGYKMPNANFATQWWFNPNSGIIAGANGNLIKVDKNNQDQWQWTPIEFSKEDKHHSLSKIQFTSAQRGYLADNYGNIYKTENAGATWSRIFETNDVVEEIRDLHLVNSAKGGAVTKNGRILITADGETWTWKDISVIRDKNLNGIYWASGLIGFVVGSAGTIVKTEDGGETWVEKSMPGFWSDLNKVIFLNSSKGFAIGKAGNMITTNDGGDSWDYANGEFAKSEDLTSIYFIGQKLGYVATSLGNIYRTVDGGETWTILAPGVSGAVNSLYFSDVNIGFAVGNHDLLYKTEDSAKTWTLVEPANKAVAQGNPRLHGGIQGLVENGIGLGGALYILDFQNQGVINRTDTIQFNRTRMTDNYAFTGSAIYSDNYDLKLVFNRSLIRGNKVNEINTIANAQNAITGPLNRQNTGFPNLASSDLAAATIYGEVQGPFPSNNFSVLANSIFENDARFLIRLPDAPNSKGILPDRGHGGTDTLIGNYWGKTEANVALDVLNSHQNHGEGFVGNSSFETFFIETKEKADKNYLPYFNNRAAGDAGRLQQGPFEWNCSDYDGSRRPETLPGGYTYDLIDLGNDDASQNTPAANTIPEKYLFSFGIYDIYDKGTDIKTADYRKRRMFPIEDFAVGNPFELVVDDSTYLDANDTRDIEKRQKYVKRWVRNPEYANAKNIDGSWKYEAIAKLQRLWLPLTPEEGDNGAVPKYYHPLGIPLYLETKADFDGDNNNTNWDYKHQAATVFFVINETTNDFIRVEMKQVPRATDNQDSIWADRDFRATVFLVPDSTNRSNSPILRRDAEGLMTFGSNGTYPFGSDPDAGIGGSGVPKLLKALSPRDTVSENILNGIFKAARNEDFAALGGRKYSNVSAGDRLNYMLGAIPNIYSNRPGMPADNDIPGAGGSNESKNTYFAGERFGALPVNVGDVIRVVSRNVLWREGVNKAYDGGIVFIIKEGPEAPVFTGDVLMYSIDSLNPYVTDADGKYHIYNKERPDQNNEFGDTVITRQELLHKVFVQTNRNYPAAKGTYSNPSFPANVRGTDVILSVTAVDRNNFYDPRIDLFPGEYTSLKYGWSIPNGQQSALRYWLMADTFKSNVAKNDANGYIEFKGLPLNPYIVPGGERLQVDVTNYAYGSNLVDALKEAGISEDTIKMYYQTFPPYLNAPYYDTTNARFLQQDTIAMRDNTARPAEDLTIFVMDSLPRFIAYDAPINTFTVKRSAHKDSNATVEKDYTPTHYQAGVSIKDGSRSDHRVLVNLTDKLRMKIDFNTDDELEDLSAWERPVAERWDFRYGRTAYSFGNLAISAGDTVIVDTINIDNEARIVSQLRPSWMNNLTYYKKYGNFTIEDLGLAEFQERGMLNIRIDSAEAKALLKREFGDVNEYNTDTLMAIVANDGHGGRTTQFVDLYVNFQPTFITEALLDAEEGQEYNMKLDSGIAYDSARAITIFDANKDQKHTFELLKADNKNHGDTIYLDSAFIDESPYVVLTDLYTTPEWLNINPQSGVLYGIPTTIVELGDTNQLVTVLVRDEDGLYNVDTFRLKVKITNSPPHFVVAPTMDCLVSGDIVDETLTVYDRDLVRTGSEQEKLTIKVLNARGDAVNTELSVVPDTIDGGLEEDHTIVNLQSDGDFSYDPNELDNNGRLPIIIVVEDSKGATDTLRFMIRVSDGITFISSLTVANPHGAMQKLYWGAAPNATVMDVMDSNYCEIEIPSLPIFDVFDARWAVVPFAGTLRNIFPTAPAKGTAGGDYGNRYAGIIQAGGENGSHSDHYPVVIAWNPNDIPAIDDATKNPTGASWYIVDNGSQGNKFRYDMRTLVGAYSTGIAKFEKISDDSVQIIIYDNRVTGFFIEYDWYSLDDIATDYSYETKIVSASPNPIYNSNSVENIALTFDIQKAGNVYIEMFDLLGNKLLDITDAYYDAGRHNTSFNLSNLKYKLSSGSYSIRMTTGMTMHTIPLIVVD